MYVYDNVVELLTFHTIRNKQRVIGHSPGISAILTPDFPQLQAIVGDARVYVGKKVRFHEQDSMRSTHLMW